MSVLGRLKKNRKNKKNALNDEEETPVLPNTSKYKNMTLFSPSRYVKYHWDKNFYITALDENNKPIVGETIQTKIGNEIFERTTDENGFIKFTLDLKPGDYVATIFFPNGEYTQSITTPIGISKSSQNLELKKPTNKPAAKSNKKVNTRKVTLYTPNMAMYLNNEIQYYAKLRDYQHNPIKGEKITFTIDNKTYTSITDEEGFARVDINLKDGVYTIKTKYEGSAKYEPKLKESTLKLSIRDIDKKIMIDIDHLTMEFKVTNDKIDTLKEFVIRTLKRNKEEKEKIKVLDDISLKVYKGDKLGILGFNGAGKSTLLKILSGIYEPTEGSIKTNGKVAPLLELGAGFDKNYTGKNNIYLNGAFLSMEESFIKEKYDEIIEFSELGEFINYPVKNYSSGMRAKLGFSIATLVDPDILIIDEILAVGDIKFRKKSAEKINSMMKDGVTVLLVSHSISHIRKICDRCIWLEDGKIAMEGEVNEVCDAYLAHAKGPNKKNKKQV